MNMNTTYNLDVLEDISEIVHYNNPHIPLYIIQADLSLFPDKTALCHWHDDVEIMYIVKGHISYNINGTILLLEEGDAAIVNARQLHYGFSSDGSNCIYDCYVFKPEILCNNSDLVERYINPVLSAADVPYTVLRRDNHKHQIMLQMLPRLYQLQQSGKEGYELMLISLLNEFWVQWYQLLLPMITHSSSPIDENIQIQKQMVQFIYKNYQRKLQINDIAAAGNVSRTKCFQIFRKYFQKTPVEFLNAYRLEIATKLLLQPELNITDISAACGFNSSSYFSEMFMQQKGCSPREFRRSERNVSFQEMPDEPVPCQ